MTAASTEESTPREISIMRLRVPTRKVSEPTKNNKIEGKEKGARGQLTKPFFNQFSVRGNLERFGWLSRLL